MPISMRVMGYKVYFWSTEEGQPIHFHVCKGSPGPNTTKFWVLSSGEVYWDGSNPSRLGRSEIDRLLLYLNNQRNVVNTLIYCWKLKFGCSSVYFIR